LEVKEPAATIVCVVLDGLLTEERSNIAQEIAPATYDEGGRCRTIEYRIMNTEYRMSKEYRHAHERCTSTFIIPCSIFDIHGAAFGRSQSI
jgi:hypothetical protein